MRIGTRFPPSLVAGMVVALVGTAAAIARCEAREMPLFSADTGYPSYLINKPACGTGEVFEDWPHCKGTERPRAKSRSLFD
jgi:hypothetical protein